MSGADRVRPHQQDASRFKTGVNREKASEAVEEEPCADGQQYGKPNLRNNQRFPQPTSGAAEGVGALFQAGRQVNLRRPQSWSEAEKDGGQQGHADRKDQDS
jgi:hypothetical protein